MSIHAAHYGHVNGLFAGDEQPVVATKKKVCFIDLIRPDFYMNFNVDQIVGILMWLKKEIVRTTPYMSRCDSMYYQGETMVHLVGEGYYDKVRKITQDMFLSRANGLGRHHFDKLYNLDTVKILPLRYHTTHAPIKWGTSQLDLLTEITNHEKKLRFAWCPNKSHKKARYIYHRSIMLGPDGYCYQMRYDYANDGSSSWEVKLYPREDQAFVDFMLDIKWWIDNGLKRQLLENADPEMGQLSDIFKIKRKTADG